MTVAIYARFSSDLQDARSIEDQVAACRRLLEREAPGAPAVVFADFALSGSTMATRPQLQALLAEVRGRRVTLVVAEALDRLSRDQADIALIHRTIRTNGGRLVTLSEGAVDALHIGLKGTMNQLFLEELARKTRRGLEGVAREGRIPGGQCFGYDAVPGKPGERTINLAEAEVVNEIFRRYAVGESPRAIAHTLNKAGAPSPTGRGWTASAINGDRRAGDGVLCQELYRGRLVFNRRRFVKDPETGRRRAEINPPEAWTVTEVPHLRLVDEELWRAVQARQKAVSAAPLQLRARPRRLLSGLIRCGVCGGALVVAGPDRYGCSTQRERGGCTNTAKPKVSEVEARVIAGLQRALLAPELIEEAVAGYHEELRAHRAASDRRRSEVQRDLAEAERRALRAADAVIDLGPSPALRARLAEAEARVAQLQAEAEAIGPAEVVALHPHAPRLYAEMIARLQEVLTGEGVSAEALDSVRQLIDRVRFVPGPGRGEYVLELDGILAGFMATPEAQAQNAKTPAGVTGGGVVLQVGAGARSGQRHHGPRLRVVA